MSTSEEVRNLPPSPEVQREMAAAQIDFFRTMNTDFRQLVEVIHAHPSAKRMERLREICTTVEDSADPLTETMFFRDIDPALVGDAVEALIDEINQNHQLAAELGDEEPESEYDEGFRQRMTESILADEPETEDDEPKAVIIIGDPFDMPASSLTAFMGGVHGMSIREIFVSLEESGSVNIALEREYERKERLRTAVIGVVAFVGAFGGSVAAHRYNKRH